MKLMWRIGGWRSNAVWCVYTEDIGDCDEY
jgi:hypothetical protein